MLTESLGR